MVQDGTASSIKPSIIHARLEYMEILIHLGKGSGSSTLKLSVRSRDTTIAEILSEVRRQLPQWLNTVLQSAEQSGSILFLVLDENGPERLVEARRLGNYFSTDDSCSLWLMCAHVDTVKDVSFEPNWH